MPERARATRCRWLIDRFVRVHLPGAGPSQAPPMVCSPQVFCRALRSRGDQLLRLMTAQQVRCDLNEDAGGCGEHSAVRAAQFGGAAMLAAAFAFGPAFEQKRTLEWDGPEVVDGQVTRHRGDVAMTVGFAHGFIEQRGNN